MMLMGKIPFSVPVEFQNDTKDYALVLYTKIFTVWSNSTDFRKIMENRIVNVSSTDTKSWNVQLRNVVVSTDT
jgi:hypothetical protein